MDHNNADNSGHILHVPANIRIPPGHSSIGVHVPIATLQYAQRMTVARGRILYEVVDHLRVIGYVLPADIATEAVQYGRRGDSVHQAWASLSNQDTSAHFHAYRSILHQFPSIDPIASRIVTERLITYGTQVTSHNIEQAVVDHACHMWTSYRSRLQQGENMESAMRAIKPRLRELLAEWLGRHVRRDRLKEVWRRWDMLDDDLGVRLLYDAAGHRRKRSRDEFETYHTASAMTWYAGKETVANLKSHPENFC